MNAEEYQRFIQEYRKKREQFINEIRKEQGLKPLSFNYFPISEEWRVPCEITLRKKIKEGFTDYKNRYERIGKVRFTLKAREQPSIILYRLEGTEKLFLFVRDLTSGDTTYSPGRIVPIFRENGSHFIDFNLACNPLCAYVAGAACPLASDSIFHSIEAGEKAPTEKISYE